MIKTITEGKFIFLILLGIMKTKTAMETIGIIVVGTVGMMTVGKELNR